LVISTISAVSAADITISPSTPGGLKQAVETAKNGDTIYLKNGVYTGENNTQITVNKNINIKGKDSNVVLDGQEKNRLLLLKNKCKVTLQNLKFTNGQANLRKMDIRYNDNEMGGAILIEDSNLIINKCTFNNNKAGGVYGGNGLLSHGGAIYQDGNGGSLTINNSIFTNNKAENDGGAIIGCNMKVNNCTFKNNQAGSWGIVSRHFNSSFTINKCTFINNKGYGIIPRSAKSTTVSKCTFKNNSKTAILLLNGKYNVNNCNFINNRNGAIEISTSSYNSLEIAINKCIFKNNRADNGYGVIDLYKYYPHVNVTINSCTFTNNKGDTIRQFHNVYSSINNCIFKNNKAIQYGRGAILCSKGTLKITNTKFMNNKNDKTYLAIAAYDGCKVTKKNVTITPKDGTKVKK
jgi:parallel beta-helix repeat protein